jgi:hypothetical protein
VDERTNDAHLTQCAATLHDRLTLCLCDQLANSKGRLRRHRSKNNDDSHLDQGFQQIGELALIYERLNWEIPNSGFHAGNL